MRQIIVLAELAVVLCLVAAGAPGCAAGSGADREIAEPPQPAAAVVEGDWDDVEAAIWTAARQMEIAVERIQLGGGGAGGEGSGEGEDTLTATLRTILAEPVTVTARRLPPAPDEALHETAGVRAAGESGGGRAPGRIRLEAQFGRFLEPDARATRLLELIERRLSQLEGVGAAPIR